MSYLTIHRRKCSIHVMPDGLWVGAHRACLLLSSLEHTGIVSMFFGKCKIFVRLEKASLVIRNKLSEFDAFPPFKS